MASEREGHPSIDVVLLPDDPAEADEFAGKAHQSVALAVARLIEGEDGGRVIGLEGSWGSGKSTIVRLLRDRLQVGHPKSQQRTKGTRVVIFDAWAHQGDPLRRAFLETLLGDLSEAEWLDSSEVMCFRKKLSGRTRTSDTTSTPKLSWEGRLAAITALLLPVGLALFTHNFKDHHRVLQGVGLGLLLLPLAVVLAFVLLKGIGWAFKPVAHDDETSENNKRQLRTRLSELQPFDFVAKQQTTVTKTTESIEGTEPTSVEFERLFSTILRNALTADRRLLIVLDNLDRVEQSDARSVLATMQTFTGARSVLEPELAARVWTLIPYDPTGLDRLWSLPSDDGGRDVSSTTSLGGAFIEKLFQAHFETPALVLSDWRGYLSGLLRRAIPSVTDDEVGAVLSLWAQYKGRTPTPRQLKQFANDLALLRGRRTDIPLVHSAYYVLLRRDRVDVADGLRGSTVPADRLLPLFDTSITGDLAALCYGTTQELGLELLLGAELDRAFDTSDVPTLTGLMEIPAFGDALDAVDLQARMVDGGAGITRMVATLAAAGAFDRDDVSAWSRRHLQRAARRVPSWLLSGAETGSGLAALFSTLSGGQADSLSELLTKIEPAAREADTGGRLHLQGAAALAVGLAEFGLFEAPLAIKLEIPPDRLVADLASLHRMTEQAPEARQLLEPTAPPDEIAKQLVASATGDAFGGVSAALEVIAERPGRVDLQALTAGTLDWLSENDPTSGKQLEALLDILDRARRSGTVGEIMARGAQDGTFMHLVVFANDEASYALVAAASMLSLIAAPSLPATPTGGRRSAEGVALVDSVLADPTAQPDITAAHQEWLDQHSDEASAILVRLASELPNSAPWVKHQLNELEKASRLKVSADEYRVHWRYLNETLGDDGFIRLTTALFVDGEVRSAILTRLHDAALANKLLDNIPADAPYFTEVTASASEIVKTTSRETWDQEFGSPNGGPSIDLAIRLAARSDAPSDPAHLEDALRAHFEELADAKEVWQPDAARFDSIAALLSAPARAVVADRLCAALADHVEGIGSGLLRTYGSFLGEEAAFRGHEKLPVVVERFVAFDDWDSVAWVADLAKRHPDTLQRDQGDTNLEYLKVKVAAKLQEFGDEPPHALSRLAELLGVERPAKEAAPESHDSPEPE